MMLELARDLIARAMTPTFAGIEAGGVAPFIAAQCVGAILGFLVVWSVVLGLDVVVGSVLDPGEPAVFRARIAHEVPMYKDIIDKAGLKIQ